MNCQKTLLLKNLQCQ